MFSFTERRWKKLMWIPIVVFITAILILSFSFLSTGEFLQRDVELSGGKMIIFSVDSVDMNAVKGVLPEAKVRLITGATTTLQVEIPFEADENEAIELLREVVFFEGDPTIRSIGPALGEVFFQQAVMALIAAFIFMAIVVFIIFRSAVPSGIVIFSVVVDMIVTMAVMNIAGIELSLPVLAALLTLIGYSVDTDILLTTKILKESERPMEERVRNGMKTGLMMTATTLVALAFLFFITGSFVLEQIAIVLIIGLIVDVFVTWFTNVGVLRVWMERRMH